MPYHRLRRLIQGQGGSTLIELLVAMPIAVALLGIVVHGLAAVGTSQLDLERRTEALNQAQIGLERMTRELRQAEWLYFRSSSVVDVEAPVRSDPGSRSVHRLVRYDCSTGACLRLEGPRSAHPPPAAPVFESRTYVVGAPATDTRSRFGRIVGHDVFVPLRIDSNGHGVVDYVDPDTVQIRLRLNVKGRTQPVELRDGVSLRNQGHFE